MASSNDGKNLNINGVTRVPVGGDEFSSIWSSDGTGRVGSAAQNMDAETLRVIQANSSLAFNEGGVGQEYDLWRKARASTFMDNNPQQVLSELDKINIKDDAFLMFDFEGLGTLKAGKGDALKVASPTELAMQLTRVINKNGRATTEIMDELNLIMHPGKHYKKWDELLKSVEQGGFRVAANLSPDERRTLTDLILYSDSSQFREGTRYGKKVKYLAAQARDAQPIAMANIASKSTLQKMRQGLHNLLTQSTDPRTSAYVVSRFFEEAMNKTRGTVRLGGQNIKGYDIPMMEQLISGALYGKQRGKLRNDPVLNKGLEFVRTAPYYDSLRYEKTLNRNITTRYSNLQLSTIARSRGVLQGKGKYLAGDGSVRAHFAPADVEMNGRVVADQIVEYNRLKSQGRTPNEVMTAHRYIDVDRTPLKAGDRLFALSGIQGFSAGKYDMVYGPDRKPIANMSGMNPLYRNATYSIRNFGQQTTVNGKSMFTMSLLNEDRGTTHFFMRETLDDLRNIVHQNMDYVSGPLGPGDVAGSSGPHRTLAVNALEDAALRRYNKMFSTESGGGVGLYRKFDLALQAYHKTEGKSEEIRNAAIKKAGGYTYKGVTNDAGDAFVRDFLVLKDRFVEEKPYLDAFISDLNKDPLFKTNTGAQNVALSFFKDEMDTRFGRNMQQQTVESSIRAVLPVTIDNSKVNLQVSDDIDSVVRNLNRAVRSGHNENISPNRIKGRLLQVLNEMRAKDYIRGPQAKAIYDQIQSLSNSDSSWYVMRDIALALNNARIEGVNRDGVFGLKTIDVENPTKLVNNRKQAMINALGGSAQDIGGSSAYKDIVSSVKQRVKPYTSRAFDGVQIPQGSKLEEVLQTHDRMMQGIYSTPAFNKSIIQPPKTAKEVLDRFVRNYVTDSTGAMLFYGGRDQLVMAVYGKDMADQVKGMSFDEIMSHNKIATMQVPMLKANQNLRFGTQERIARVKADVLSNGKVGLISGFEELLGAYSGMKRRVIQEVTQGNAIDVTTALRALGNRTLQDQSQNRSKVAREAFDDPFAIRQSRGANWLRRGTVDFNDMAEMWWKQNFYNGNENLYDRIKQSAQDKRITFAEAMGGRLVTSNGQHIDPGMKWAVEMEEWLKRQGVNVNSQSIKNTLVNNDVRSFHDVGELTPFGNYNPGAREKHFKVMNYLPLDRGVTERALADVGVDPRRAMGMGVTTGRAMEVFGDEVNFLSMRTAHMDSQKVAQLFGNATYSTYDGMFMLRKSLAGAFTTTERKNVRLSEGAAMQQGLAKLLGIEKDKPVSLAEDIILDKPITLAEAYERKLIDFDTKKGRITVGGMVIDQVHEDGLAMFDENRNVKKRFIGTDFFEDKNIKLAALGLREGTESGRAKAMQYLSQYSIQGWNADSGGIMVDMTRHLETGDKMLGLNGLRGTVTLVDDAEFERAGLKDVQAVMPNVRLDHRDYGVLLNSSVNLAYDEMRKQVTSGKIALEHGLATLREVMSTNLGINKNMISIQDSKIVVNELFGLNGEKVSAQGLHGFLDEMGKYLGADLINEQGGYMLGQTGLAVSATPKWHDEVGRLDLGEKGKVRWGLKEIDMIQDRLNRYAEGGTEVSAIHKWLNNSPTELADGVRGTMLAQNPEGPRVVNALNRVLMTAAGADSVRPGEVIIQTQATKGAFGPDNESGRNYAHLDDSGVIRVSGENFDDLPKISQQGGFLTVQDLQRTIINAHQSELPVGSAGASTTLGNAIMDNHGTMLVQLPEGMERSHVRFMSTDLMPPVGAGQRAVMNDIQSLETSIWRGIRAVGSGGPGVDVDKARERLGQDVERYHQKVAQVMKSSRDGSVSKTRMSVMHDMSGRFHIQGVNPSAVASGYEEATTYFGRERAMRMISGAEYEIAQTLGMDIAGKDRYTVQNFVLEKMQTEGLYGFVGRYPTNSRDTLNIHKIMIDPNADPNFHGARVMAATAEDMLADFDGDNNNVVLSHYRLQDEKLRREIHEQMGSVQRQEAGRIAQQYAGEYPTYDAGKNFTVSDLAKQEVNQLWEAQRGGNFDLESTVARVNASIIGRADNIRYKMWNLADDTFDVLARNGLMTASEAIEQKELVQEFGRRFSQGLISSKQFNVQDIADKLGVAVSDPLVKEEVVRRQSSIAQFIAGISQPDPSGMRQMREANSVLGIYKPDEFEKMATAAQNLYKVQGVTGNWMSNESLNIAVSSGDADSLAGNMLQGKAGPVVRTPWVENLLNDIDTSNEDMKMVKEGIERGIKMNEDSILASWDKMRGSNRAFGWDGARLGEEMLSHTAAEGVGMQMKNFAGQVFGGLAPGQGILSRRTLGIGGAVFGGIWAASAITKGGPTPEGNEAQQEGRGAPVPKSMMAGPTARVSQNPTTEDVTIRISGKDASSMSGDQISALVQGELNAMMPMGVNMNMNINDNSQNINREWLQGVMANALNFGNAF